MRDQLATWSPELSPLELKENIRSLLLDYHHNEVAVAQIEDKRLYFLVCLRNAVTGHTFLWKTGGATVIPIEHYSLIGSDDYIYKREVEKLYRPDASILRCILLGIHLFLLARETSNYIGGPTRIIGLLDTSKWAETHPKIRQAYELAQKSVWEEDQQRIRDLEQRMSSLDITMSELLLDCADTTIHSKVFADNLEKFKKRMLELRDGYIRRAMYSQLASFAANAGKPAIGVIPPYLEIGAEMISVKDNDPLNDLLHSFQKDIGTTKPQTDTNEGS